MFTCAYLQIKFFAVRTVKCHIIYFCFLYLTQIFIYIYQVKHSPYSLVVKTNKIAIIYAFKLTENHTTHSTHIYLPINYKRFPVFPYVCMLHIGSTNLVYIYISRTHIVLTRIYFCYLVAFFFLLYGSCENFSLYTFVFVCLERFFFSFLSFIPII